MMPFSRSTFECASSSSGAARAMRLLPFLVAVLDLRSDLACAKEGGVVDLERTARVEGGAGGTTGGAGGAGAGTGRRGVGRAQAA